MKKISYMGLVVGRDDGNGWWVWGWLAGMAGEVGGLKGSMLHNLCPQALRAPHPGQNYWLVGNTVVYLVL